MIEVRNLVKVYGNHTAVDDLSFTVEKGQIYGFLGPNGAGKSTTMNIITGYLAMTSGEVIINGHNIMEEPELARQCIGYLPEQPPLYNDMTVSEYLDFAAELKKVPKDVRKKHIKKVMRLTHLTEMSSRLIKNLSKGYRQRVGLAQAIMGFPEVIILDEPTVGLDPKQIIEIRELIRQLGGERTVILSSHILSEIQEVCDKIMIIHHGKLVACGTAEELEREMSESAIELTVRASDLERAKEIAEGVPGVVSVSSGAGKTDAEANIKVSVDPDDDLREAFFNAFSAAGVPLLMLKSADISLEHIFLEITSDKVPSSEETAPEEARLPEFTVDNDEDGDEGENVDADGGEEAESEEGDK